VRPIASLVDDDSATLQILPDVLRIHLPCVAIDVSSSRANALHRLAAGSYHGTLRALERDAEIARRHKSKDSCSLVQALPDDGV